MVLYVLNVKSLVRNESTGCQAFLYRFDFSRLRPLIDTLISIGIQARNFERNENLPEGCNDGRTIQI